MKFSQQAWAVVHGPQTNFCQCENPEARRLAVFERRTDAIEWAKKHFVQGKVLKILMTQTK